MTLVEWLALAALVLATALAVPVYLRRAAAERVIARLREPPARRRPVKLGPQPNMGSTSVGLSGSMTRQFTGGYPATGGYGMTGGYPTAGYAGAATGYPSGGYPPAPRQAVGGGYPASASYPSQGGSVMRTMMVPPPRIPPPAVELGEGEIARELPRPGTLRHALLQAGVEAPHQRRAETALLAAWALAVAAAWGLWSGQAALLTLCVTGLLGRGALHLAVLRRRGRIVRTLPDAVDLVCGGLFTGYELPGALAFAVAGTAGPLRVEVRRMLGGIEAGLTPAEAMQRFASLVPASGPRLLARTVQVGEEVGGTLAPAFRRVARALRENARVAERVDTTSTVGVTSALAIFAISWAVPVLFELIYPGHLRYLVDTRGGQALLLVALTFQAVGAIWVQGLVNERRAA